MAVRDGVTDIENCTGYGGNAEHANCRTLATELKQKLHPSRKYKLSK
jgi:hypothetical protein